MKKLEISEIKLKFRKLFITYCHQFSCQLEWWLYITEPYHSSWPLENLLNTDKSLFFQHTRNKNEIDAHPNIIPSSEVHKLCRERKKEKAEWAISESPAECSCPYVIILDHFLSFPLLIMDVFQLLGVNTLMYCSPSAKSCAPNVISML